MVFLVLMTGEAGLACDHLPCVWCMATGTRKGSVLVYFVKTGDAWVTRPAIGHGLEFSFLKMARLTALRHHGCRGINLVTGDAVQRRPVTRTMAEVTEDSLMFSF